MITEILIFDLQHINKIKSYTRDFTVVNKHVSNVTWCSIDPDLLPYGVFGFVFGLVFLAMHGQKDQRQGKSCVAFEHIWIVLVDGMQRHTTYIMDLSL